MWDPSMTVHGVVLSLNSMCPLPEKVPGLSWELSTVQNRYMQRRTRGYLNIVVLFACTLL